MISTCNELVQSGFGCPLHQLVALVGHALQHGLRSGGIASDRETLQPAAAAEILGEDVGRALGHVFPLKRIIASRRHLDKEALGWSRKPGHGLEALEDLLRNAERRASQQRYDDAVGRFYRAMELTEQLLLKQGVCKQVGKQGIETGSDKIDCLPTPIQEKWRIKAARKTSDSQSIFKIGLTDGFELLGDLGHPTGLA